MKKFKKQPISYSSLKEILSESKSPYREIMEWAEIAIEDLNRMGAEGFKDEDLLKIARYSKTPYYDDIIEIILSRYNSYLAPETIEILSEYKDGEGNSAFTVRSHILSAIENFVAGQSIDY